MRELEIKSKDHTKVSEERPIEKQVKFVGDIIVRPGQKCYEFNLITGNISEAKVEVIANPFATGVKIDIFSGTKEGEPKIEQKVITDPNCMYTVAINRKNAERKFNRIL